MTVQVKGIDRDGESRVIEVDELSPEAVARNLHRARWKYAVIIQDGEVVAGVQRHAGHNHRSWWKKK